MNLATDTVRARLEAIVSSEGVSLHEQGGIELPLAAPSTEEQAVELVRLAATDGLSLLPLGLGSKAGWCEPAERADFVLSTRALEGVLVYEPGDGTVSARAGTRMADLAARVREGGHRLVPDVPRPETATLGGVVAAAASGVRRLRLGPVRDHVLGVRALLADGTIAKSGGQLVKNVTGYDLHRLYCGSHGTLCVILEASLRLFALPEEERAFVAETGDLVTALQAGRRARELALPLDVCSVLADDSTCRVTLAVSGRRTALDAQASGLRATLADLEGVQELSGTDAAEAVTSVRDAGQGEGAGWPALRVATLPSRVAETASAIASAAGELGASARLLVHPGIATVEAWFSCDPLEDLALELAPGLARLGASATWPGAPSAVRRSLGTGSPGPTESAALALMRHLRDGLDPQGVFARGRFHGGL